MSTTIKGWADPKMWDEGPVGFRLSRIYEAKSERDLPATLIIGDEPVFTEAQVKELLKQTLIHAMAHVPIEYRHNAGNAADRYAKKHGITLP